MKQPLKELIEIGKQPVHDRRWGKRLYLNFSIEMRGVDSQGRRFVERTKTTDISDSGCQLRTNIPLKCGDFVEIKLIPPKGVAAPEETAKKFEVVWVEEEETGWSVGARNSTDEKIWKVSFPSAKSSHEPRLK